MSIETEFDIAVESNRVIERFDQRDDAGAIRLLASLRFGQPLVVQESLDRFVLRGAESHVRRLANGFNENLIDVGLQETVRRLQLAEGAPRFPLHAEMQSLESDEQRHDVYASIVLTRGSASAREALIGHERVVLGLRQENSTLVGNTVDFPGIARADNPTTPYRNEARLGTGVYDDRMVVLWKRADGMRGLHDSSLANTEPTAQYDARARPSRRQVGGLFADVVSRRTEGVDVNGDGVADLGRMAEGTFEMQLATHPTPGPARGTHRALRPTANAVGEGQGGVQRDSNGDGWFTREDVAGRQPLNNTFKIHMGSRQNTDSAGCQTVHPTRYQEFINAVTANPLQTRWQYVLTSTTPGAGQDLQVRGERIENEGLGRVRAHPAGAPLVPPAQPQGPRQPALDPGEGQRGEPGLRPQLRNDTPAPAPHRPDDPRHPNHALLLQIRGIVCTCDGAEAADESRGERLSRALLPLAVGSGMTSVDHLMAHGGKLFLVQGRLHDPANLHASIDTQVAMRTGLEQSDRQLEEVHRRLGTERAQQQGAQQGQVQSSEALSLRV